MTTASMSGSFSATTAARLRPWYISMVQALRRSGRLITTRKTPLSFVPSRYFEKRSIFVMLGRYVAGVVVVKPSTSSSYS